MANSKEVAIKDLASSPEFIQELLPSAERTALLYHLSYLCLGEFPKLERIIRDRAVETQLLFGSSEALLLKCVETSDNLVTLLFPMLKKAVEKNKPNLANKYLEKAIKWIDEIIDDVGKIVKRYEKLNVDVASSTSDISTEKKQTKEQKQQQTSEMKALQKILDDLEKEINNVNEEKNKTEKKMEEKESEIQTFISTLTSKTEESSEKVSGWKKSLHVFTRIVPFISNIISYAVKMVTGTTDEPVLKAHTDVLSLLTAEKENLRKQEWEIQNKLMQHQLKLAQLKIENGDIPDANHLVEVQKCLTQIQQILIQLQVFWEKVGSLLNSLKQKTSAGEDMIEDLDDLKEEFLESVEAAKGCWTSFGKSCIKANGIFSIQAKSAYKFLEISPSSLSKDEWQTQYDIVIEKLQILGSDDNGSAAVPAIEQ
ncbi:chromosome partition protein Smc-like [Xyrauchen texanus]|uniref:chromosome partition protein Smc-like n=1 Tax=Xyrauchen texanus TaxID=154827 RepID=UPI002242A00A|nr:chromosome partition protein Smc-like [Xyrauchen texanus]